MTYKVNSGRAYRAAAKYIAEYRETYPDSTCEVGMCDAVQFAVEKQLGAYCWSDVNNHQQTVVDWMHPTNAVRHPNMGAYMSYWGKVWGRSHKTRGEWQYNKETVYECRILALCFMAAIADAGDL